MPLPVLRSRGEARAYVGEGSLGSPEAWQAEVDKLLDETRVNDVTTLRDDNPAHPAGFAMDAARTFLEHALVGHDEAVYGNMVWNLSKAQQQLALVKQVPPALDDEAPAVVDLRPAPGLGPRQHRERGRDVEVGKRARGGAEQTGGVENRRFQP